MNILRAEEYARAVKSPHEAAKLYADIDFTLVGVDGEDDYDAGERALGILRERFGDQIERDASDVVINGHIPRMSRQAKRALDEDPYEDVDDDEDDELQPRPRRRRSGSGAKPRSSAGGRWSASPPRARPGDAEEPRRGASVPRPARAGGRPERTVRLRSSGRGRGRGRRGLVGLVCVGAIAWALAPSATSRCPPGSGYFTTTLAQGCEDSSGRTLCVLQAFDETPYPSRAGGEVIYDATPLDSRWCSP